MEEDEESLERWPELCSGACAATSDAKGALSSQSPAEPGADAALDDDEEDLEEAVDNLPGCAAGRAASWWLDAAPGAMEAAAGTLSPRADETSEAKGIGLRLRFRAGSGIIMPSSSSSCLSDLSWLGRGGAGIDASLACKTSISGTSSSLEDTAPCERLRACTAACRHQCINKRLLRSLLSGCADRLHALVQPVSRLSR